MIELGSLLIALVVVHHVRSWFERREHAQEKQVLLSEIGRERELWHRERQLLLNRIKPETAQVVTDPSLPPVAALAAVHYDDDDGYWESREELAERMMAEETRGAA